MITVKHNAGELVIDPWVYFPLHKVSLEFFLSKVEQDPEHQDQILNEVMEVLKKKEEHADEISKLELIRKNIDYIKNRYGGSWE